VATPPPQLGQDTDAVLGDLGLDAADIATLREQGVI
jgi:crotonobetainyl-CoA:carnitine CoA-transferase CaiB-like acyl-CoA transferase